MQWEDLGIALVAIVYAWFKRGSGGSVVVLPDHVTGVIALMAAAGAIVALATRTPGESAVESNPAPGISWALIGPLVAGISIVAGGGVEKLGGDPAAVAFPVLVVAALAIVLAPYLPTLGRRTRRVLVAPFVFVSSGIFSSVVGTIAGSLGTTGLSGLGPLGSLATVLGFLGVVAAAGAVFYVMLVVVPRDLASPGSSNLAWIVRFAVFLGGIVVGVVLGGAVPIVVV